MKLDRKSIDLESLDELISRCEDSMINPFRKKKAVAEPEELPEEVSEEAESEEKPDLSDMDMEDLLRMYEEMKSKKE